MKYSPYKSPASIAGQRTSAPMITAGLELERLDEAIEALRAEYDRRIKAERWADAREIRKILERRLVHRRFLAAQVLAQKAKEQSKRKLDGLLGDNAMVSGVPTHV